MRDLFCFTILALVTASGCATGDYAQSKDIEELRQEIQALRTEVQELKKAAVLNEPRKIDLSKIAIAPREVDAPHLVVSITKDDKLYLANQEVTPEKLTEELKAVAAKDPKVRVVIRADDEVSYKRLIEVMDLAKSAGVEDIVVANIKD
jgi:biopolymer transport protein ExbD